MRSRIEIGGARPYKFLWGSFLVPRDRVKRTLNKLSGKASNCCYIMYLRPNQKSHQEKCPSGVGRYGYIRIHLIHLYNYPYML